MKTDKDVIIIGGGAAGMAAAQYSSREGLKALLVEEMSLGGQALLIEGIENYPGCPEAVSGFELAERFETQARKFGAEFLYATVKSLVKKDNVFTVETTKGTLTSLAVILAAGAKHRHLGVPGEEKLAGRGVSYCASCDGPFFKNQKIIVVGGGDSACDEAMFLSKLSSKIVLIHRRDRFRAQKALADRVLANKNIEVRLSTALEEIRGKANDKGIEKVSSVILKNTLTGETYEEETAAVFIFAGSLPSNQLVPDVPKDSGGCILTDEKMETATGGLFCAGDLRSKPFRQLVIAAAEGALAAHSAAEYIDGISAPVR
ncbi:MAG: FAD-dependent oxidoreductase [Spirochaetales bacterium]|jgi:thioredoxin reductase (NADPH)|nr:FAD-dependent oxidoreductase [Spirochaetales bacterium]